MIIMMIVATAATSTAVSVSRTIPVPFSTIEESMTPTTAISASVVK